MTNITGKIYQQTNDDGTENRFPKTVVPAVIGLSQYLQDQFNTLSDLYMPKEGESESKTGQEITYRKSEATINAKTVTIDRIYGKTLVWNQMQYNGDFSNGTDKWIANYCTISLNNKELTVTVNHSFTNSTPFLATTPDSGQIIGHKYLVRFDYYIPSSNTEVKSVTCGLRGTPQISCTINDAWTTAASIQTSGTTRAVFVVVLSNSGGVTNSAIGDYVKFRKINVIDLTNLGIDNLSTVSDVYSWLADNVGLKDYYPYNPGTLISNDIESIETVGFNLWDNEWESGYYNVWGTGQAVGSNDYHRSKNFIPCLPSTKYYYKGISGQGYRILAYGANKEYLGSSIGFLEAVNSEATTPAEAHYLKIYYPVTGGDYNRCINISNASKNGQYEPYCKSELKLNLNSIKVKSHNIWDEEWENGVIQQSNGQLSDNSDRFRSKNFIPVKPNTKYYSKSVLNIVISAWGADHSYLGVVASQNAEFTTPNNCYYLKFYTGETQPTYQNNICINVSSSFNGQYEPHGTITINGLKSTPNGIDEIIGNKFIKRNARAVFDGTETWLFPGSDYHWPYTPEIKGLDNESQVPVCNLYIGKAGASGFPGEGFCKLLNGSFGFAINPGSHNSTISEWTTYLASLYSAGTPLEVVYPLATPIEYELAEPLTYTFKAGTTEERISPNSDGLSAPFCCDLTYNASETAGVLDALQGLSRKLELIEERLNRLEDDN